MIGISELIAIVIIMSRMATMCERSALLWGFITFIICMVSTIIPIPFINLAIGGFIAYLVFAFTGMRN